MSPNTPQTSGPVEPVLLSPVESYFWRFEEDMAGAFRVTVLLRLDGCIEADLLAAALEQLQRRHPKLRAVIAPGADGRLQYRFDRAAPPIPFEIIDCSEVETPWRETTRRILQTGLPPGGPMAAVTVLRNRSRGFSELFLSVPHAIADGLSGIMLVDDLLAGYARAEAGLEAPPGSALPMVSPPRAKPSGGWRGRFRLFRRFLRLKREESRSPLTALPEERGIPPQSQWVHWVFSQEETLRLVRRCRKERTSLSGALVAAACCGLRDCLPGPEVLFKWQLPFNIRESLEGPDGPVTPQDLGCFVSNMNGTVKITGQTDYWDVARHANQELQTFIQQGGPSFGYNMASFFYGWNVTLTRLFTGRQPKMTPSINQRETLLATHYGVVNIRDAYGSLRPRECTLMFKNEITGPSLVMEALVLGQRLNIGFAGDDLDPRFWEQLHATVRRRLDAAVSAGQAASAASVSRPREPVNSQAIG